MPKMKTKKAAVARFKVTGTGKLLRNCPGKRHKLSKKTSARKLHLSKRLLVDESQVKMYKQLMGV
ncbi:50S ribosomal protein L35 [Candidatus Clavichlamydia salmonicola]|uniref:50S ribosomal protein L35 n=1 Tax=Candidatus Clavichlamydia salmonicola TaxID=469812 RepID=UPI00189151EF|nr:50S ribosomal protein L35 [Candidatus Clavichlamydia salmonicola]MBF5050445.1 50S ribosomal protein L35 [Candidatus Clavichlamydia salmonicola]